MWDKNSYYRIRIQSLLFKGKVLCYNIRINIMKKVHMKKEDNNIIYLRPVVELGNDNVTQVNLIKKNKKRIIVGVVVGLLCVIGVLVYMQLETYTSVREIQTFEGVSGANSNSDSFAKGILRYGKDGATYMTYKGESIWNHPYEMNRPLLEKAGNSAAIADGGGNKIVVFNTQGVKGEIETTLPIEKISVSQQGIVAVILKDQSTPKIVCYDAVGNILVEHKSSFTGTGYPIGIALSLDGQTLLVTYLHVDGEKITTNYAYYNFAKEELGQENVAKKGSQPNVIIPEVRFITHDTSVMIGDEGIEFFKGKHSPENIASIIIEDSIVQVFYGDGQVGLVLQKGNNNEREIRIYNEHGKVVFTEQINGIFTDIDIVNNQVVVYDKERSYIFNKYGMMKFHGEMKMELAGIYPVTGINKYVVIGNEGMKEVRLMR